MKYQQTAIDDERSVHHDLQFTSSHCKRVEQVFSTRPDMTPASACYSPFALRLLITIMSCFDLHFTYMNEILQTMPGCIFNQTCLTMIHKKSIFQQEYILPTSKKVLDNCQLCRMPTIFFFHFIIKWQQILQCRNVGSKQKHDPDCKCRSASVM